jgi:hypothetical protein
MRAYVPFEDATTTSARIVPSALFTPPPPLTSSGPEPSPKRTTSGSSPKVRPTASDLSRDGPELAEAAERNASRSSTVGAAQLYVLTLFFQDALGRTPLEAGLSSSL